MVAAGTGNDEIMAARGIRPLFDGDELVADPATSRRGRRGRTAREPGSVMMERHTLSVLVEDKPGVLARVSGLFSRRGFNIESLAVGPTEHPDVSRMTIVVAVEDFPLEQVTKQLNKLVHVIKIVELEPTQSVQRELLLVKVRADPTVRSQVLETVAAVPRQGRRRHARVADHRGHGHRGQDRGPAANAGALRHPRDGAVGHGRRRPRAPLHHRHCRPLTLLILRRKHHRHEREHLLRRRRRSVDHPGPQGRGDRLRQPGPRARAVPARLRRRRADRPARGLEEPRQGRGRGPAGRHARPRRPPRPT